MHDEVFSRDDGFSSVVSEGRGALGVCGRQRVSGRAVIDTASVDRVKG